MAQLGLTEGDLDGARDGNVRVSAMAPLADIERGKRGSVEEEESGGAAAAGGGWEEGAEEQGEGAEAADPAGDTEGSIDGRDEDEPLSRAQLKQQGASAARAATKSTRRKHKPPPTYMA